MLKELQFLQEVKADTIEVFEDLQLVINQLIGLYINERMVLWSSILTLSV